MIYGEKFLNPRLSLSNQLSIIESDMFNTKNIFDNIAITESKHNNIGKLILDKFRIIINKLSNLLSKIINFIYDKIINLMKKINKNIETVDESCLLNEFKIKNIDIEYSFMIPAESYNLLLKDFDNYMCNTETHIVDLFEVFKLLHNAHISSFNCDDELNKIRGDLQLIESISNGIINNCGTSNLFIIKNYTNTSSFSDVAENALEVCGGLHKKYTEYDKLTKTFEKKILNPIDKFYKNLSLLSSYDNYKYFIDSSNELYSLTEKYLTECTKLIIFMIKETNNAMKFNCDNYLKVIINAGASKFEVKQFKQNSDEFINGKSDLIISNLND